MLHLCVALPDVLFDTSRGYILFYVLVWKQIRIQKPENKIENIL